MSEKNNQELESLRREVQTLKELQQQLQQRLEEERQTRINLNQLIAILQDVINQQQQQQGSV